MREERKKRHTVQTIKQKQKTKNKNKNKNVKRTNK